MSNRKLNLTSSKYWSSLSIGVWAATFQINPFVHHVQKWLNIFLLKYVWPVFFNVMHDSLKKFSKRNNDSRLEALWNSSLFSLLLCFSWDQCIFQIAAEIAAPLRKTEEIVLINDDNGNKVSSEVTKLLGQLPPSVKALTGVDLSKVSSYI